MKQGRHAATATHVQTQVDDPFVAAIGHVAATFQHVSDAAAPQQRQVSG